MQSVLRIIRNKFFQLCCLSVLLACSPTEENRADRIRVGTIVGPETILMEVAAKVAKEKSGITIEIIPFEDYVLPNTALADGSIDANAFQHQVYLNEYLKQHPEPALLAVGKTFIYPMAIYSLQHTKLMPVPEGAQIAIPNDVSNGARALLLLAQAGLITLKNAADLTSGLENIQDNPFNIKLIELDAAQLPRILQDVDFAVINTNYSVAAGLELKKDALFVEPADSPYANIIVVKTGHEHEPRVKALVQAMNSTEVLEKAEELFQGQAVPAWNVQKR